MKFAKSRAAKASIIVGLSVILIAAIAPAFGRFRSHDLPSIIAEWRPWVVMVNCNFLEPGGQVKTLTESGVLLSDGQDGVAVLTNRAVFDDDQQLAGGCSVTDDGSLSISLAARLRSPRRARLWSGCCGCRKRAPEGCGGARSGTSRAATARLLGIA